MWLLGLSAAIACTVALSLFRAVRQGRRYETLDAAPPVQDGDLPPLAAIVPMRNEANNIGECLAGLMAQDYPAGKLRIVVIDDNSTDDSASIVRDITAGDRRVRLMTAGELPGGWLGKPHACWRGALAVHADWLCFVDADTVPTAALLRSAVTGALQRRLDLLSLSPFQELTFFLDRLVIPIGFLAIAVTQDVARIAAPRSRDASINGQVLLVRAEGYFDIGGHAAVRGEVCEDAALARRIKAAGLRIALLGAERLVRVRMYRTARGLWEGLSKNVTEIYGGALRALAVAVTAAMLGWSSILLPPLAFGTPGIAGIAATGLSAAAACALFATAITLARHFRIPWWYGLLFPVGTLAGLAITINGVYGRARRTVAWKGRVYSPRAAK